MSAVLAEFGFELNRRLVSDRRVEASPIVDLVDARKNMHHYHITPS
jgi:hypothetical protein